MVYKITVYDLHKSKDNNGKFLMTEDKVCMFGIYIVMTMVHVIYIKLYYDEATLVHYTYMLHKETCNYVL